MSMRTASHVHWYLESKRLLIWSSFLATHTIRFSLSWNTLQWRHNEHNGVSNHQCLECLLNRLFRRRSKISSKLCVIGLCEGNPPVDSLHKGPVTREMFPFVYVIMISWQNAIFCLVRRRCDGVRSLLWFIYIYQYICPMNPRPHYNDVIMGTITSQITSLSIVYSIVYSDVDQRKHQSSASLAFVRGIHGGPVNSPHIWPVRGKCFHWLTSSWGPAFTLCKVITNDNSFYIRIAFIHRLCLWESIDRKRA